MITKTKMFFAAFVLTANVVTVFAQQPSPTPAGERTSSQSQGCAADNGPRHDHGMEKGMGPAGKRSCASMDKKSDSMPTDSSSTQKGHDHGKFHKGQ